MPTVLMINHMFPPFSGVGVIRVAKFVRYLPAFGWRPIVLTCQRPEENQDALDHDLLNALPEDLEVHRVFCPSLYEIYRALGGRVKQGSFGLSGNRILSWVRSLFVPDPYVGWYLTGMREARRILQARSVDLVYTSSPRETAHLIGYGLQARFGCRWVADFRDPWIGKFQRPKRWTVPDKIDRYLEAKVLEKADRIVVAWDGIARSFKKTVQGKVEVITNGFDESDFEASKPHTFDRFTLLYAGSLYRELNPEPLFQALRSMIDFAPKVQDEFQLILLGRCDAYVNGLIRDYAVHGIVNRMYQMPHRACLKYVQGADVLCVVAPDADCIPSKLFDCLRTGLAILCLSEPTSEAFKLADYVHPGICVATRDAQTIACHIFKWIQNRHLLNYDCFDIKKRLVLFDRKYLTKRLAHVFDDVVREH